MAAIGVVSALRVAPLTSSSNARSSPARCRAGVAPSIATNPRSAASFGGVRDKTALASPVVGGWATRMRAPKAPTVVAKAAAAEAPAAGDDEKDFGKTLRIASYIFGWYFLNAVFGAC
jgi:hypothetical protein